MRSLRALRALSRIELRGIRRHARRSWLVVLMIAVPVAAMVGGSSLFQITQRTPDEERAQVLGRAALRIDIGAGLGSEGVRALIPAHARVEIVDFDREDVSVPGRRLAARSITLAVAALEAQGLAAGMLRAIEGRSPANPDEVALSPVLAHALARTIGEEVTLASGPTRITGLVVDPESLDMPVVLRAPGVAPPRAARAFLVDVPKPEVVPLASRLRAAGQRVTTRADLGSRDELESIAIFVGGGFGFFEAALVISAAFAVSLRRRQREIGLLGATGATIGDLRASLGLSAIVFAAIGALLGVIVGLAAAAALHPFLDGWNRRWNGAFEASTPHVLGAVLLGLAAAVAAAVLPAYSSTRLPIRVALSGRRPVTRGSGTWLGFGLVLVAGGFGLMLWGAGRSGSTAGAGILGGSILGVLGLGACSPWMLGALARCAAPLPLPWRLAVRDAGRFRARNGPVVTAVLAGMSVSVMLAALVGGIESMLNAGPAVLRDDQLVVDGPGAEEVARRLSDELGCVAIAPLAAAYAHGELVQARVVGELDVRAEGAWIAVGDDELLRALDAGAASSALKSGQAVAFVQPAATRPAFERSAIELSAGANSALGRIDAATFAPTQSVRAPRFVLGAASLPALVLEAGPPPRASLIPWIVRLNSPVTADTLEHAQGVAAEVAGTSVDAALIRLRPASVFSRLALLLSFVTGLIVVFIATALSSVESAADARILHTVGAAPGVLRLHDAARAGYLAFIGCVLAIPAGLIPSYGLLALADVDLEFAVPWSAVLIVAVGLPAIAFLGAWTFSALQRPPGMPRPAVT